MTYFWSDLAILLAFSVGLTLGYRIGYIAKRVFLTIPPPIYTVEEIKAMYEENERIRKLNLAAKMELDKLRSC